MIISLREFMTWTDMTIFELWVTVLSIIVTSILLVLKLHEVFQLTFSFVFLPIFVGIIINFYFLFIVFVRKCVEDKEYRGATTKFVFNSIRLSMCGLFAVLLLSKIGGEFDTKEVAVRMSYALVFSPIWVLMSLLVVQVCRAVSS